MIALGDFSGSLDPLFVCGGKKQGLLVTTSKALVTSSDALVTLKSPGLWIHQNLSRRSFPVNNLNCFFRTVAAFLSAGQLSI